MTKTWRTMWGGWVEALAFGLLFTIMMMSLTYLIYMPLKTYSHRVEVCLTKPIGEETDGDITRCYYEYSETGENNE